MFKLFIISFLLISISSFSLVIASELPPELENLNGHYTLVDGSENCDNELSILGYKDLSLNFDSFRHIYFNNINKGRTTSRCMSGIGSKEVYKTVFKDGVLTNFNGKKSIGCFTPKVFVKLEKESQVTILDDQTIKVNRLMRYRDPQVCIYNKI